MQTTPWIEEAGQAYLAHFEKIGSADQLTRMAASNGLAVARAWLVEARQAILSLEACYSQPSA